MVITQKQIDEFKTIYLKQFGKELTNAEAQEKARKVLRLMELVLGIN